jgi:hypothetical protein
MSLYSEEEVCQECKKAVFHKCCKKFCRCKDGNEAYRNFYNGTCEYKTELTMHDKDDT